MFVTQTVGQGNTKHTPAIRVAALAFFFKGKLSLQINVKLVEKKCFYITLKHRQETTYLQVAPVPANSNIYSRASNEIILLGKPKRANK